MIGAMATADPKWPLSHRLKAARELAGLSVLGLAEKTGKGLGRGPIQEVERGARGLDGEEIARIARACGVNPAFFYIDFKDGIAELAQLPDAGDPLDYFDAITERVKAARENGVA